MFMLRHYIKKNRCEIINITSSLSYSSLYVANLKKNKTKQNHLPKSGDKYTKILNRNISAFSVFLIFYNKQLVSL